MHFGGIVVGLDVVYLTTNLLLLLIFPLQIPVQRGPFGNRNGTGPHSR